MILPIVFVSVLCCSKVLLENHAFKNGFYEKNETRVTTGHHYDHDGDDYIMYFSKQIVNQTDYFGWIVGKEVGWTSLSNLVYL